MKLFRPSRFVPLLASLAFSTVSQAALTLDFNTPGQLDAYFSTGQTDDLMTQVASGGLGNSGRVDLSNLQVSDAQLWTLDTSFSGDLDTWMAEFYLDASIFRAFGFTTGSAPRQLDGLPVNEGVTAYLPHIAMSTGADATSGAMGFYNDGNLSGNITQIPGGLPDGWYRYRIQVDYLGSNNFSVTGTIHNSDATGALLGQVGSVQDTFNNAALASAEQVHIFFGINEFGRSIDNFTTTAVPEPAGLGLAMLSAASFFLRRRR